MLDNERYNQAIETRKKFPGADLQLFLDEQYKTQLALNELGIDQTDSPSKAPHVGTLMMTPENILNLRIPYAVEVLGMPHAGKTTMINRYLSELWQRDERNKVSLVTEGAASIKESHGDLRYTDPFSYSMLSGTAAFTGYIDALKNINSGTRMIMSDRGQVDRRVWRRALFLRGGVNPDIMSNENKFIDDLENTPIQLGGIIMFMVKPSESIRRAKSTGPITNIDFLHSMYEQYWRLHRDILQGDIPFRVYTCIDAEKSQDEVYERFKYAADTMLNVHNILFTSLAEAFPDEFDEAKAKFDKNPKGQTHAERILSEKLGKKVKIVGGDEMKSDEEILRKQIVEGIRLRK